MQAETNAAISQDAPPDTEGQLFLHSKIQYQAADLQWGFPPERPSLHHVTLHMNSSHRGHKVLPQNNA